MTLKINPFHQLVWRTPHSLQIGIGEGAVVFENVTRPEEKLIDALYYGIPEGKLGSLCKLLKLDTGAEEKIVTRLEKLVVSESGIPQANFAAADLARASFGNQVSANLAFARRGLVAVQIQTMDATGLALALALAASGVGHILTPDQERVSESDCATNLYPRALLGYRRFQAAKLILDSSWPGARIHPTARVAKSVPKPLLAVITSQQVTDPNEAGRWLAAEVPMLEIRYEVEAVQISPILDGTDGCLNCQTHWLQESDPTHTAVAAQLLESGMRFDDSATRLIGCGFALRSILQYIDGLPRGDQALRISASSRQEQHSFKWVAHPACACQLRKQLHLDVAV